MSRQGRLRQGRWQKIDIPTSYSEKQLLKYAPELCEYVSSDEEKCVIRESKTLEEGIVIHAANSCEMKAFTTMWEFESKDPVTTALANNKVGSRKKEPTYLALESRVQK